MATVALPFLNTLSAPTFTREEWNAMTPDELRDILLRMFDYVDLPTAIQFPTHPRLLLSMFRPLMQQHRQFSPSLDKFTTTIVGDGDSHRVVLGWNVNPSIWTSRVPTFDQWYSLMQQSETFMINDTSNSGSIPVKCVCSTMQMLQESNTPLAQAAMQFVQWVWNELLTHHDPRFAQYYSIKTVFMVSADTNRTFVVNDPGFGRPLSSTLLSKEPGGTATAADGGTTTKPATKPSNSRKRPRGSDVPTNTTENNRKQPKTMVAHLAETTDLMLFVPFFRSQTVDATVRLNEDRRRNVTNNVRRFKFGIRKRETGNYLTYTVVPDQFPWVCLFPNRGSYIEISPTHRTMKTHEKFNDGAFYMTVVFCRNG